MRTQADRDFDLASGRELERKDAEIDRLRKIPDEIADMIAGYSAGQIRMAAGEMSAQEMRTVQAVQRWFAVAIRHRFGIPK